MTPKHIDAGRARQIVEKGRSARWWKRRGSAKRGFRYLTPDGAAVGEKEHLERIRSLAIPPAWRHVRISPSAGGKLQAIGIDGRGRVQYLYHPKFAEARQRKKFAKIERFGSYLPKLRRLTNKHISLEGLPRDKVLAVMIRLINSLYIRIGGERSARDFRTYGITTLGNRHVEIKRNGRVVFEFVGKGRIKHRMVLVDRELADLLRELRSLGPSRKLFHYIDDNGKLRAIRPSEINGYLKSITAPEFSSKDLRTWGATLLAAIEFAEIGTADDEAGTKKNIVRVVRRVAAALGNTPAVCRASYIHPFVIESYEKGVTIDEFRTRKERAIRRIEPHHEPEEVSLLRMFAHKR